MATVWHQYDAMQSKAPLRYQQKPSILGSRFLRLLFWLPLVLGTTLLLIMLFSLHESSISKTLPTKKIEILEIKEEQETGKSQNSGSGDMRTQNGGVDLPEFGQLSWKNASVDWIDMSKMGL